MTPALTCDLCRYGYPVVGGRHVEVSERGQRDLGPCTEPPKAEARAAPPSPARSHEECRRRLAELANRSSVSRVLAEARETHATLSQPREIGEEG